jgi:hypothetical protein
MNFSYICNCKKINFFKKNYTYWENRKTTQDEIDVIDYLKNINNIKNKSILHVGIGNSFFSNSFYKNNKITGITISRKEIFKAQSLNLFNYIFFLIDKYSIEFQTFATNNKFDLVVDVNLKSYTCCQDSFKFYMNNLSKLLNTKGMIITSKKGMSWYKHLKPKLSFNIKKFFYFKMKEIDGNSENILSENDIDFFNKKNLFNFYTDKKICYFLKKS